MKKITFVSELADFKPRIWRRFEISDQNTIQDFIDLTMIMYAMTNSHLHHLSIPVKVNDFVQENLDENGKLKKPIPKKLYDFEQNYRPNPNVSKFNIYEEEYDLDEISEMFDDDFDDGYYIRNFDLDKGPDPNFLNYMKKQDDNILYMHPRITRRARKKNNPLKKLEELNLRVRDRLDFYYDYGDDWHIRFDVEKIEEVEKDFGPVPKILRGRGHGIIEDIGGTWGLEEAFEEEPILKIFDKEDLQDALDDIFKDY